MFVSYNRFCIIFYLIIEIHGYFTFNRKLFLNLASQNNLFQTSLSSGKPDIVVDVAVIGGGIAGTTISWLLQEQQNLKVAFIDPNADTMNGTWYPNYGEWRDEWHTLSSRLQLPELKECTTTEWEITDCFFGGFDAIPMDERTTLERPYVRVDRIKMQSLLRSRLAKAGGIAVASKLSAQRLSNNLFDHGILHSAEDTTLTIDDGRTIKSKVVIDATGFESKIVARESPYNARGHTRPFLPGFQIAYGFIAYVDSLGPYNVKAMTLFDYRTDHIDNEAWLNEAKDKPTFIYVMPLKELPNGKLRVFFEETSLVGRDERRLTFEECKKRAMKRLAYHNITVFGIEEEEYCYIPMGGELPDLSQRIIAFGAAANMVHPSTGYQACRMLAAATEVASTIGQGIKNNLPPDAIAAAAYEQTWNTKNRLQRDFQSFGGEFLMAQDVDSLRGFFSAFFSLSQPVWSGFLAGYPGLPCNEYHDTWTGRFSFALGLFFKMPTKVQLAIMLYAIKHTFEFGPNSLLRSVTPPFVFGSGPPSVSWSPPPVTQGSIEAKEEARRMMKSFKPTIEEEEEEEVVGAATVLFYDASSGKLPSPFDGN